MQASSSVSWNVHNSTFGCLKIPVDFSRALSNCTHFGLTVPRAADVAKQRDRGSPHRQVRVEVPLGRFHVLPKEVVVVLQAVP